MPSHTSGGPACRCRSDEFGVFAVNSAIRNGIRFTYFLITYFCLLQPIDAKKPDFSKLSTNELSKNSFGFASLA